MIGAVLVPGSLLDAAALLRARLRPSELLSVILAFEGNGDQCDEWPL